MKPEELGNRFQSQYGESTQHHREYDDSLFGNSKKYQNYTKAITSEIEEALRARGKASWKILNKIGNKINTEKQRKGLYQMICLNHQCLENIAYSNGTMDEEILKGSQRLWKDIKKIANCIKPYSKTNSNDNLNRNNFIETFRKFSLSKTKAHHHLQEIEKLIQDKSVLTTKEEYLDKLLPYLATDLDFLEQFFSSFRESQHIEKTKCVSYAKTKLEKIDRKIFLGIEELGNTIRKLKPLAYREVFLKATGKGDHNIYNYLEDFEIFQEVYTDIFEALFENKECNNLKKYLILSELLHIIKLVYESLQQGSSLYREEKARDKDDPLNKELEELLFKLDKHSGELSSINTKVNSSEIQEAIDFIINTTTQYTTIMKRLLDESTLPEMNNH